MPKRYTNSFRRKSSSALLRSKSKPRSVRAPKVVNIMDALKKSMQAKGQTKVRDAVRKRMGKEPASEKLARASKSAKPTTGARRSVH